MVVDSSLYDQLVNQMNVMVGICTPSFIVSTLMVAIATLSVNKMKVIFGNVYTKFYSVNTYSCSSNAKCKPYECDGWQCVH